MSTTEHRATTADSPRSERSAEGSDLRRKVRRLAMNDPEEDGSASSPFEALATSSGGPVDASVAGKARPHLGGAVDAARVHTGPAAQQSAAAIGARAFTYGSDIYMGAGESTSDVALMSHELTHVRQQAGGAAEPARAAIDASTAVGAADAAVEKEADEVAAQVTAGASGGQLVVEDGVQAEGAMGKTAFLQTLRSALLGRAEPIVAPQWSVQGCPFIEAWFRRQEAADAGRLWQTVSGMAPGATTADALVSELVGKATDGLQAWKDGEDISGHLSEAGMGHMVSRVPSVQAAQAGRRAAEGGTEGAEAPADARSDDLRSPAAVMRKLGDGKPLDAGLASDVGRAYGSDYSGVRVHTDSAGASVAEANDAVAVTVGHHIAMKPGAYRPDTLPGKALMAHELAHVDHQAGAAEASGEAHGSQAAERDADLAARGAVGTMLGVPGARAHRPRERSALALQRCSKTEFDVHYDQNSSYDPDFDMDDEEKRQTKRLEGIVAGNQDESFGTQVSKVKEAVRTTCDIVEAGNETMLTCLVAAHENVSTVLKAVADRYKLTADLIGLGISLVAGFAGGWVAGTMFSRIGATAASSFMAQMMVQGIMDVVKKGVTIAGTAMFVPKLAVEEPLMADTQVGDVKDKRSLETVRSELRALLSREKAAAMLVLEEMDTAKFQDQVVEGTGKMVKELYKPITKLEELSQGPAGGAGLPKWRAEAGAMKAGSRTKDFEKAMWRVWLEEYDDDDLPDEVLAHLGTQFGLDEDADRKSALEHLGG